MYNPCVTRKLMCLRQILSTMVRKMVEYPKLKFIWAEISYLSMWWAEQTQEVGEAAKKEYFFSG